MKVAVIHELPLRKNKIFGYILRESCYGAIEPLTEADNIMNYATAVLDGCKLHIF